jgi:hypothetical protein
MPFDTAISTSWDTWFVFSSERCIGMGIGEEDGAPVGACDSGRGDERTSSGWTAWGLLLILGKCAPDFVLGAGKLV